MTAFAKVTEQHDLETRRLTPCAERLYHWLLRAVPSGITQEVFLEDFAEFAGYSLRHIRRALDALLNSDLVEVTRAYSGRVFKLVAYHPGQKPTESDIEPDEMICTAPNHPTAPPDTPIGAIQEKKNRDENVTIRDEKVQNGIEMSQKQPSNPHSMMRSDQIYPKTADTQINFAPKENIDKESAHLLGRVAEAIAPEQINPQLRERVLRTAKSTVEDAIELIQYRKLFGDSKIKNLPGLFVQAIRERWHLRDNERARLIEANTPLRPIEDVAPVAPQGFKDWFDLAQIARVVQASRQGQYGVEVLNSSNQWEPWEGLAVAFPLPQLKDLVRMQGYPIYD
jgi:hypothetical protein